MKSIKIEIKWAILFSLMMLAWMFLERLAGLHDQHIDKHAIYTNFVAIPSILLFVLALKDKKKNYYSGQMSFAKGFISGLLMTGFIVLIVPLNQYITLNYIMPDYFKKATEYALENKLATAEELAAFFNAESYLVMSLFGAVIMGIVTSAIVAVFVRTKESK